MLRVVIGEGSCGIAAGAGKVHAALEAALKARPDVPQGFSIGTTGCIGMCYLEPIVDLYDGATLVRRLVRVTPQDAPAIVGAALGTGLDSELAGVDHLRISAEDEGFLSRQTRIVLRHCGVIDPTSIDDYRAADGYQALAKVLLTMTPEDVIQEIKTSGLAGRGGAGFPTWFKWNAARNSNPAPAPGAPAAPQKYLICNADEGDPGAFMDRAVLESDPHSVIEGMLIGAYAIGAQHAVIYVRAEYPLAIRHLELAMDQARAAGLLGNNILGSGFSCDMRIKAGAGAFVCGEETALIASLEGQRGMPRLKPPFPAERGYQGCPSNINNVETFANVAWIINNGGAAYAQLGTPACKGTKVFALTGKIARGGLVEIPMGATLRHIIFDIGGGIRDGGTFKAVQLGGPSGGCIPEALLDTPVEYKAIAATGAIMGSGGMVVMDQSTCMVGMAKFFLDFTATESCGKCVPCRLGTERMREILARIVRGEGREGDVELLEELCTFVGDSSMCGLGQTAPNPVLTTIRYFRDEYDAHIRDRRCPARECVDLLSYHIDPDRCVGCTLCASKCPAGAIEGQRRQPHAINQDVCIKCGQCARICRKGAISAR